MIVVDSNVIAYFWIRIPPDRSALAHAAWDRDPDWMTPPLWISEFRSILRRYVLNDYMTMDEALRIAAQAEEAMIDCTQSVDSAQVLRLVSATGHSSYDCEYVALAQALNVPLVTGDRTVARLFPDTAVRLDDFAAGSS